MKSVTYWYQFFTAREELVPILHDVKFTKCEICGSTLPQLSGNKNELPESLISSSELSDDSVSKFTSLVRARD